MISGSLKETRIVVKFIDTNVGLVIIVFFRYIYLCMYYLVHTNKDFLFWCIRHSLLSSILLSLSSCYISARLALRVS